MSQYYMTNYDSKTHLEPWCSIRITPSRGTGKNGLSSATIYDHGSLRDFLQSGFSKPIREKVHEDLRKNGYETTGWLSEIKSNELESRK